MITNYIYKKTIFLIFCYLTLVNLPAISALAQSAICDPPVDIDCNGSVNSLDLSYLVGKIGTTDAKANIDGIGTVNTLDLSMLLNNFGKTFATPTPAASKTPTPSIPPVSNSNEWNQDARDAQRTGYASTEPSEPWSFVWSWNGPDSNGGTGGHSYNAPKEARTVTGANRIYIPAGNKGIYGLDITNGRQIWNNTSTTFNAAPAYDPATQSLIAGGSDGKVYKLNSSTGTTLSTYSANSPVTKAILINNGFAYAVSDNGVLHKIRISDFSGVWTYSSGSTIATPPSYSATRQIIIYATDDLNVHAVNDSNGTQKWKVKPSPNSPGFPNEFELGWPVIADASGIVFLRMRLDHNVMDANGIYPNTMSQIRSLLTSNPSRKNLFALNLDNGSEKFIPAVGYGSTEDFINGQPYGAMGSQPVVRRLSNSKEVAYIHFRSGQSNPPDYRWDSHMGEMVLDSTTVSGLQPGDLRFIRMSRLNGYGGVGNVHITDEQNPITVAGETIFHAHWGASESVRMTDRSDSSRGLTYANPINISKHPTVIRRQANCSNKNTSTHYTTCGLTLYNDGRYWDGPGFWVYWNVMDPPGSPQQGAYSAGFLPRYTYVSNGYIIIEGNGGDIFVLKHS